MCGIEGGSSTFTRFGCPDSSTTPEEPSFRQVLSNGGCRLRRAVSEQVGFSFEIRRDSEGPIAAAFHAPIRLSGNVPPNKRLKLTARVDYGMNSFSARRSLSAI